MDVVTEIEDIKFPTPPDVPTISLKVEGSIPKLLLSFVSLSDTIESSAFKTMERIRKKIQVL